MSASAASAGLVTSQTSGVPTGLIELDPLATRMRRLQRAVMTAGRMHQHEAPRSRCAMLTATYREVGGWVARHVAQLLKRIREWLQRRGHSFRYVWVAELQERGAMHYHVLVWLPRGLTLPKPDKQGWWPHGSTRIEWARAPIGYLCKYASKLSTKSGAGLPAGARLHGRGGLDELGRAVSQWFNLPAWAREVCDLAGRAVRVKGVGLVERGTGVCMPSPWRVSRGESGSWFARQAWSYARCLRGVAGPFSWLPGHSAA